MKANYKTNFITLITTAMALLYLFLVLPPGIAAAEGFRLSADQIKSNVGEQITVTISADQAAGTEGGQFILNFNPALVRPVAIESGSLVTEARNSLYMANLEYSAGQLIFMWVTAAADTANSGVVCKVIFDSLKDGETLLEFGEIVIVPVGFAVRQAGSGKITIGDAGVNQEESDENNLDQEDEAADEDEEINSEDQEQDRDDTEEVATNTRSAGSSSSLVIGLVLLVVSASAGYYLFRRSKKPGVRKNK